MTLDHSRDVYERTENTRLDAHTSFIYKNLDFGEYFWLIMFLYAYVFCI